MGQRSPLVTLAAAAVGLVALLVVNSTQTTSTGPASSEAAVTSAPVTPPNTGRPAASPSSANPQPTATKQAAPTPSQQGAVVYAGRTANREATLAIAVKGGRAAAYVCDGRRVEAWLTGTRTGDTLALRSRAGDRLAGSLGSGQVTGTVTGTVTVHGRTLRFTISKADPPAGLYRAKTSGNTIGWIVLADGSQVGIDNDGTPAPAPPLDPSTGTSTVGGTAVTATSVTGDETF
ncbi:hypothetical protein [Kribbella sp. NPDC049227]|uniref:hypothetical protein n=1 Tax=Kribbella sp. NPDC049227 TaxID=3364113 RepID=UPI00371B6DE2